MQYIYSCVPEVEWIRMCHIEINMWLLVVCIHYSLLWCSGNHGEATAGGPKLRRTDEFKYLHSM